VTGLSGPIGILDEHPEWSNRLMAELRSRGLPFEKIDHSNHAYDPADRHPRYSVIVNRSSPSSHRRGHASVLFYTEALLNHYEATGVPVINPVAAYRFEKSKALQVDLFERLGVPYPRTIVVNHPDQVAKATDALRFPVLLKPNVGGSGAGIRRFDTREELESRRHELDFGPDGTALLQEYVEPEGGAIVRVEVLDGRCLYAIRIVREAGRFNLCPADLCRTPTGAAEAGAPAGDTAGGPLVPAAPASDTGACPVELAPGLRVTRYEPPAEMVARAIAIARAARIDVGGIEYLVGRDDGRAYFYDVNATSNFVADAPRVLGFDPFPPFADYIVRVAREGQPPARTAT
jgi:hypothetical protein